MTCGALVLTLEPLWARSIQLLYLPTGKLSKWDLWWKGMLCCSILAPEHLGLLLKQWANS